MLTIYQSASWSSCIEKQVPSKYRSKIEAAETAAKHSLGVVIHFHPLQLDFGISLQQGGYSRLPVFVEVDT